MDHAACVREFQRFDNLPGGRERIGNGQRTARQSRREILTIDQLHDERRRLGGLLEAIHVRDVGVVEPGERACLALETRDAIRIRGDRLRKDLQRDVAAQSCVAGTVDLTHAPGAERAGDFIDPDPRAGAERHREGKL